MRIKYFQAAWGDIRNSEGWFGKLCLLGLVGLIPIFGQIVVMGYLYGWAREMAWGVHEPMPAKVFGNEDGKLYRRGWFVLLVAIAFSILPTIVIEVGNSLQGVGFYGLSSNVAAYQDTVPMAVGAMVSLVGAVGAIFMSILAMIASMRVSIYNNLSSGFQFGQIWKMLRHDTSGIMRIFGMNILVSLIVGLVLTIVFTLLIVAVVLAGVGGMLNAGFSPRALDYASETELLVQFAVSAGFMGLLCMLVGAFVGAVSTVFVELLVARALGYWTLQFDVPHWRGQADPLPFELQGAGSDYLAR